MEGKKETEHVPCYGELRDVLKEFDLGGKSYSIPKSGYHVNFEGVSIFHD